jgi:WD40 repeat protein
LSLSEGPINCIRSHAAGPTSVDAFVACYSGTVVRVNYDADNGLRIRHRLKLHEGAVKSVRIHPGGRGAISCAADGSLVSWDLAGIIQHRFAGHTAIVDDVDFDPTGQWLASVSRDFTVNVYEFSSGRMLHSMLLGRQSPKCVLFWNEQTVIVGNYWGDLWRVDLDSRRVGAFRIATNGISSLSRCGSLLVATSYDGSLCLVDPHDMAVLNRLESMQQKLAGFETRASFDS